MIRRRNTPVVAAALLVAAWALVHSGSPVDVLGSLLAAGAAAQGGTASAKMSAMEMSWAFYEERGSASEVAPRVTK